MNVRPPQITDDHLRRNAAVYTRQSSAEQVRDNVGSTMVQRDLASVPLSFGWPESAIEIRDDLGSSADEPGSREELETLLRDMAAGRVGAVVTYAFNRLGRNEVDQAAFAYTARIYNVLLIVGTAVYDFRDPNSAFAAQILGFGAVHEHRVKLGLGREARRRKAEIGLEPTAPPIGLVKPRGGPYLKTDDDRIREVIQIVWDSLFRLRSGRAVVRYLRGHGIQLPYRVARGIAWRDATWDTVHRILKNRAYAGTYVYGQTEVVEGPDSTGKIRKRQVPVPKDRWLVKPGVHPGYVTEAQFNEVQKILAANRIAMTHPPGRGDALLQGLVRCQVHTRTFNTVYDGRKPLPDGTGRRAGRYICLPGSGTGSYKGCCSVPAERLDRLIEVALFARLGPTAIDELHAGFEDDLREHKMLVRAREDERRRAERRAAELEREYLALPTEATHRHVKDRLRTLWEEARARLQELETNAVLDPMSAPARFSDQEMEELRRLVTHLPEVWRHPSVTAQQRKTLLRLLVKDVVLKSGPMEWDVTIFWAAGGADRLAALKAPGARVLAEELHCKGRTRSEIATALTEARAASLSSKPGYSVRAVRHLVRQVRRERGFQEQAFRFIHAKYLARERYTAIARELNNVGIPHYLGAWTATSVGRAIARMQRTSVFGLPLLARTVDLRDEVKRIKEAGVADASEILARLIAIGCLTKHRRPPSLQRVQSLLRKLEREASKLRQGTAVQNDFPL